ncbi:hypothetical protein MBT84_35100 [Streptomyces sp. MBT84]|nr:hypothetical protein [Streptomyces sp. MBT84]
MWHPAADGHEPVSVCVDVRARALERIALNACERAAALAPRDPTAWVAGPVLVRLHEIREPAPQGPLIAPPGP